MKEKASDAPAMRVLVVEDDSDISSVLRRSLMFEGYDVSVAADGEAALSEFADFEPDLVLLDLGLPKIDGTEVLRRMREGGADTPVILVTARDTVEERVEGLDTGADDYLVKPFDRSELLARVRAALRRTPPRRAEVHRLADLVVHADSRIVTSAGRQVTLTQREFELLAYLIQNAGVIASRERLLEEVWGYDPLALTNTVDVTVSNLRHKLEAHGEARLLHTVRGAGYVLREEIPDD